MIEFAILDANTLACMGLKSMLHDLVPTAEVTCFSTFEELVCDTPYVFTHYFVSSAEYFQHVSFFYELGHRVVLLVQQAEQVQRLRLPCIDVSQPEHAILQQIMRFRALGGSHANRRQGEGMTFHGPDFGTRRIVQSDQFQPELSAREVEVLCLMVKGNINKQIAEALSISLTTVITHRKKIQEKTGIRSLSGLTVYAILSGYVRMEEI